nr:MAG TPA: hypothetical protein [Caudoviricetes sp.]
MQIIVLIVVRNWIGVKRIMTDKTCNNCIDNEDGFCDCKGILVDENDTCEAYKEANKEVK